MVKVIKRLKTIALGLGIISAVALTSCSDDDGPGYSERAMDNTELKTILMEKGYTFNEQGALLLDDKVKNTTSLDLSGTGITDFSGLELFPNLTDLNLSNNGYGPLFDMTKLPEQITSLDLRKNEIFDFDGLVDATVVNDEVKTTIIRELSKLYLPESAKWNIEDLMPFYIQNKADGTTIDMQMVNSKGVLEAYNTLREIPDEYFRAYLKMNFSSIFATETAVDISKSLSVMERGNNINLWYKNQFANISEIKSIEGIEYFINNPYYNEFYVSLGYENPDYINEVSYLMPRSNIRGLALMNTNTKNGIDLSKATNLVSLAFSNNENLEELSLQNTLIANQDCSDYDASLGNLIQINNCPNLEKIELPNPNKHFIGSINLINLPKLKQMNLSTFNGMGFLVLLNLPNTDIVYPSDCKYGQDMKDATESPISFAISEDVFNMTSTQTFITNNRSRLRDAYSSYRKNGAYKWSKYL